MAVATPYQLGYRDGHKGNLFLRCRRGQPFPSDIQNARYAEGFKRGQWEKKFNAPRKPMHEVRTPFFANTHSQLNPVKPTTPRRPVIIKPPKKLTLKQIRDSD